MTDQGSNVVELLREIKGETDNMDDDLQNLDPAFLHGMNLNSLVREFEMEASGGGSDLGILALADDSPLTANESHFLGGGRWRGP